MKRINHKKNLSFTIVLLLILVIGIGYAYLTSNLSIAGNTNVATNTWNIHFENINISSGSVTATSEPTLSNNNTAITYTIDLNRPKEFYEFTVDVKNDGTLPGKVSISELSGLSSDAAPIIDYSIKYTNGNPVNIGDILNAGAKKTIKVRVFYKDEIDPSDFPSNDLNLTLTYTLQYVQSEEDEALPIIGTYDDILSTTYLSNTYKDKIRRITLQDSINIPNDAVISWDISDAQDNSVMAYLKNYGNNNNFYDLYIQGEGGLVANTDSSYLFGKMENLNSIIGIDILDTSETVDMSYMFAETAYNSGDFNISFGNNFDTSNVTNMEGMFYKTCHNGSTTTISFGNNFDTSNVTNMKKMFYETGYNSISFVLSLAGDFFNTSSVTDMSYMFYKTGYNDELFILLLSESFDTSNVLDMSHMFEGTGYSSTTFSLNLEDNFDTSSVTDISYMFYETGYTNEDFILLLGDKFYNTSVNNVDNMFVNVGYNSNALELDLSNFDFSINVDYSNMISGFKSNQTLYVNSFETQDWIINNLGDNNEFSIDNVLVL